MSKRRKKNSSSIIDVTKALIKDRVNTQEHSAKQIVVLETAKEPYQEASKNIDLYLLEQVQEVNNAIGEAEQSYQDRIDAGGASDLFWRIIGTEPLTQSRRTPNEGLSTRTVGVTYILRAEKLSRKYSPEENAGVTTAPGYDPDSLMVYGAEDLGISTSMDLKSDGTDMDQFFQPKNLLALVLSIEPYSRDVLDTFVNVSIGTADLGSTRVFLSKKIDNLKVGQIVSSDPIYIFPESGITSIVGFGTAISDLTEIPNSDEKQDSVISYIDVKDPVTQQITSPMPDGNFPTFTISISPTDVPMSLAVGKFDSPYILQQLKRMEPSDCGVGVSIVFDKSGKGLSSAEWNHFMEDLPDPDNVKRTIRRPNVGGGKVYYKVGFQRRPMNANGNPAQEGDIREVSEYFGSSSLSLFDQNSQYFNGGGSYTPPYEDINSNPQANAAINEKLDQASKLESSLSSDSVFFDNLDLANKIKEEYNELNLRIWGYRMQLARAKEEEASKSTFNNLLNQPQNTEVTDTGQQNIQLVYTMSKTSILFSSTILTMDIYA